MKVRTRHTKAATKQSMLWYEINAIELAKVRMHTCFSFCA